MLLVLGVAGFTVVLGAVVRAVVVLGAALRAAVVDGAVLAADVGVELVAAVAPSEVPAGAALVAGIAALMAMPVTSAVATPMLSEAASARPRGAAWGRRPR